MDNNSKWFTLIFFAFLFNGIPGIMSKSVIMSDMAMKYWYIFFFYIGGLVFSLLFFKRLVGMKLKDFAVGLLAGVFSFAGALFGILSLSQLPAYLVFPVTVGGIIPVTALTAYIIFKETLSKREIAGIAVGFLAIVLFSFG